MAHAIPTFGGIYHRLVPLKEYIVEKGRGRDVIPLHQLLGCARVQRADKWRHKVEPGFVPDLKVEVDAATGAWHTVMCPLIDDRWGLSVSSKHEESWKMEWDPMKEEDPNNRTLSWFLEHVAGEGNIWEPSPPRKRRELHDAWRFICFHTAAGTPLPDNMVLDVDDPSNDARMIWKEAKAKPHHALLVPTDAIHVHNETNNEFRMPGMNAEWGCIYRGDNLHGHWDQWQFCSIVQLKAGGGEREEVNGDPGASLLLNALEFASESIDSASEQLTALTGLRDALIKFAAARTGNFELEDFVQQRSGEDKQVLLKVVKKYIVSEPQDETLVSQVTALLITR